MLKRIAGSIYQFRIIDSPGDMSAVEEVQRVVWPGDNTEVVPAHLLLAAAHNGGLVIGAYLVSEPGPDQYSSDQDNEVDESIEIPIDAPLVGYVFGFPGTYKTPDGPRLKHCSHMLAVLPAFRDRGIGFALKRAQWQLVRNQGVDRITWTYDPLQSRNAYLNIARLGAVCNTYIRDAYGGMRDELNIGMASDRFQVDWWVNTNRVERRLSRKVRTRLDLAHFLAAGAKIINPSDIDKDGIPRPAAGALPSIETRPQSSELTPLLLIEIPADISRIKSVSTELGIAWRQHTRDYFEYLFNRGYLVTDFIYLPGKTPRSFYVLSHGESTL
jgi:predicted GNAT superfamily acetyltransferase